MEFGVRGWRTTEHDRRHHWPGGATAGAVVDVRVPVCRLSRTYNTPGVQREMNTKYAIWTPKCNTENDANGHAPGRGGSDAIIARRRVKKV
jgi:hypothetical protein